MQPIPPSSKTPIVCSLRLWPISQEQQLPSWRRIKRNVTNSDAQNAPNKSSFFSTKTWIDRKKSHQVFFASAGVEPDSTRFSTYFIDHSVTPQVHKSSVLQNSTFRSWINIGIIAYCIVVSFIIETCLLLYQFISVGSF